MKKRIFYLLVFASLMASCAGEFNKVYKTSDYDYRYEYAKQMYAEGKYSRAATLLQDMITMKKG
jgi:outer membrane protein assembly factor BamD